MLATNAFTAIPSREPLLTAPIILDQLYRGALRNVPGEAPTESVGDRWRPKGMGPDCIDRRYHELCVLTVQRAGLRSVDAAEAASHGYGEFTT